MKTLTLLCLLALPLSARTIDWGNAVDDVLLDSHGVALDDSFLFELGSFGSFVPTAFNIDQWQANWKAFDRAQAPSSEGWNSASGFFSSSATVLTGGLSSESAALGAQVFGDGEQAYIWAYNSFSYDPTTEWALITNNSIDGNVLDDWLYPAPGGKTDTPLEWRMSTASTLIFGGLADTQGNGYYTVDPGTYALQTHTVVPEPGSVLLVLCAGIGLRCCRRRSLSRA